MSKGKKAARATPKRVNGPKRRGQNGKSAISASKRADLNGVFRADVVSTRIKATQELSNRPSPQLRPGEAGDNRSFKVSTKGLGANEFLQGLSS